MDFWPVPERNFNVFVSRVIPAPRDAVWDAIKEFDKLADWLPVIESSKWKDNNKTIRCLVLKGGGTLEEVLIPSAKYLVRYAFSESAAMEGVSNYEALIRLTEITHGPQAGQTFATWEAVATITPDKQDHYKGFLTAVVFGGGFDSLAGKFQK